MIEEAAIELVAKTKEHFKRLRENAGLEKMFRSVEAAYFEGDTGYYDGLSKVKVTELHNAVERIVPKIDKVVFPPDGDYFAAAPKNPEDELEVQQAERATALIKDQFADISIRNKLIGIDRDLCIYGTVFVKTYWNHIEKKRYKRIDGERVEDFETTFDNPDFYSPNIWDIYADPKDENLNGAIIEDIIVEYSDLYKIRKRTEDGEEVGIFDNVEKLKDSKIKKTTDQSKAEADKRKGVGQHEYGFHEHKVLMTEYWGQIPLWFFTKKQEDFDSGELVEEGLIVVGSTDEDGKESVLLRIDDNPFDHQEKPYLRVRYIKINGRLYGIGAIVMGLSLEASLSTAVNQLNDMRTFMLRNKWLRLRDAGILEPQLQDLNNKIIDTDDMNGLEALRPPDFSASALAQIDSLTLKIQDATGATKLLSGTPSGGSLDRTAAGIATVVSSGLEKFELVVTTYEEELLKPLVKHFWMLDQQFLPEGRDVRLIGQPIIRVTPNEIAFNFELNFVGIKELGEKEFKMNALNILIQNVVKIAPFGLDPVPLVLKQVKLMGFGDLINEIDKRPDGETLESSPEGEVQLLQLGRKVKIDLNDDHDAFIAAYDQLLAQPGLAVNVRQNTEEAKGQRLLAKSIIEITQQEALNVNSQPTE